MNFIKSRSDIYECDFETRVNYVNLALVMLSVIFVAFPLGLNFKVPYPIKISVIILWYLNCVICDSKSLSSISSLIYTCSFIVIFEFMYLLCGYSTASIGNYYNTIIYYDIIIKAYYVMLAYNLKAKIILFRFIQIYIMITCYYNGIYGSVLEKLYEEGGLMNLLDSVGVATTPTEFYNMLIFYVSGNVYVLIRERNRFLMFLDVLAIGASFYFIFSYQPRATSLFLMSLLSVLIFVNRNECHLSVSLIIKKVILFFLVSLLIMFVAGNIVIEFFPERVALRVQAMFNIFSGDESNTKDNYLGRFTQNLVSIRTWLSNFMTILFGVGHHLGRDYYNTVGQHSFYIDYLAKYGLIGTSIVVGSIRSFINTTKICYLNKKEYYMFMMFFIIYLLLGFLAKSAFAIIALGAFLYSLLAISINKYYAE